MRFDFAAERDLHFEAKDIATGLEGWEVHIDCPKEEPRLTGPLLDPGEGKNRRLTQKPDPPQCPPNQASLFSH